MSVWHSRWAAVGAAAAVALGGGGVGLVGATASSGERPVTITVEPTRILDTRVDLGLTVSVDLSGQANFMYGVHAVAGTPRFHDLVVDARGEAQATVFGVEFLGTAGGSVDGARVRAENGSSGNDDAVGMKALNAGNVRFGNAVTSAEARGNAWGLDSVNSDLVLHDVDSAAVTTADGSWARGLVCSGGSLDADDLRAHASSDAAAPTALFGTFVSGCGATIASSELVGTASAGSRYGLDVNASSGAPPYFVRDSYLAGESSSIRTLGYTDLHVVNSQLDGGATSSGSPNDQSTCTAVTHGSGTTFTFTAGPVSDCP